MAEPNRIKPRVSIVMSPERRALAEELARERGFSLSVLLETLVLEEAKRRARAEKRST
jgi:prolyl-tRNA editing enzyme YbaK/EbsC (Cys-tRNA(Pro) deacylase)